MDARWGRLAAVAASQHGVFSIADSESAGVTARMRSDALRARVIERIGPKTFRFRSDPERWEHLLVAGLLDLGTESVVAGRAGGALLGLDGFRCDDAAFLVPRHLRGRRARGIVVSTTRAIPSTDICRVNGIRCLRAERLILESPLFRFTRDETENAVDSAIRLSLTTELRLAQRVRAELSTAINGRRALVDALIDAGGHSKLERRFLTLLRVNRLPRPRLQVRYRDGTRTVARVDALFGDDIIVEVDGHGTHATRQQRRVDAQRRTELTLRGKRVLTFTSDDVFDRPEWVASQVSEALSPSLI